MPCAIASSKRTVISGDTESSHLITGYADCLGSAPTDHANLHAVQQHITTSAMSKRFSLRAILDRGLQINPFIRIAILLLVLGGIPLTTQAQGLHFSNGQGGEIIQSQGQQSAAYSIGTMEPDYYLMNQNPGKSASEERGFGWWARVGADTGPGLGREESLTFFEAMPHVFWGESMIFSDLRLWRLNSGRLGGNVGVGLRSYYPQWDRTLGVIAWYDVDATYKEDFEAFTLSLESRGNIDWLSNIYLPFDVTQQQIGLDLVEDSQQFVGTGVQFDQIRTSGFALKGFDMEVGAPVGLEFAKQFDLRAYLGFYYFHHNQLDDIWGWKARLEANVFKYLDLNLAVTDDETFDTRLTFSASWTIDPNGEVGERRNTWDSMVLPPTRLWTIPKAELAVLEANQVVMNPLTGTPLSIVHVSSVTGSNVAGAGSVTNPFDTINNAVNGVNAVGIDTYDILYTHSGSQFDSQATIVVPEGKRFLGGGDRVEHLISYNEFGTARLPRAAGNYSDNLLTPDTTFDSRPLFTNQGSPAGPGVTFDTLASLGGVVSSNSVTEFSGFVLGNPDFADPSSGDSDSFDPTAPGTPGQGTFGNGIEFVDLPTALTQIRFVDLHGSNGNGLHFVNNSDTFLLESLIVNQSRNTKCLSMAVHQILHSNLQHEAKQVPGLILSL
ncbi:MAG: hypothetical protein JKY95_09665 [Planctomycetaceae bacterium]|nr:hypothetical protein [Planctomycetaceae bacterium]